MTQDEYEVGSLEDAEEFAIIRMARDGIQSYLSNGGLFNPEEMNHDKVRELIMLCRDVLDLVAAYEREKQAEQEPVAWMYVNCDGECEQIEYGTDKPDDDDCVLLYTAPVDAKAIRAEALEEVAKWFEGKVGQADLRDIAIAIRSLK